MGTPLFTLRAAALASAVAFAGLMPAVAAPLVVPGRPAVQLDVVRVGDSAEIIRRDRLHRDDGAWKKKRRHFRERRHDDRNHGRRDDLYQPKATQKFAYDAYGNLRIYDGDGWDHDWDGRDHRNWDGKKKRKRPRIYKMHSLGVQEPSPGLKGILTTVPD